MSTRRHPVLDDLAEFTWNFGNQFFVETSQNGCWIWSDPDYGGDHTLRKTDQTLEQWLKGSHGRDKGKKFVARFVGDDVRVEETAPGWREAMEVINAMVPSGWEVERAADQHFEVRPRDSADSRRVFGWVGSEVVVAVGPLVEGEPTELRDFTGSRAFGEAVEWLERMYPTSPTAE